MLLEEVTVPLIGEGERERFDQDLATKQGGRCVQARARSLLAIAHP